MTLPRCFRGSSISWWPMSRFRETMNAMTRFGRHVLVASIMLATVHAAGWCDTQAPEPRADANIQALIERAVGAIVRGDADVTARFDALRDPGIGDRRTVLLQLALYLEGAVGTERSMSGALILQQLGFTPEEKLQAILPHLDTAGPGLRHVFTELLGTIDRPEGGKPDFHIYENHLEKMKGAPPRALIRYLYEVSPDTALASMERVYGSTPARRDDAARRVDDLRRL